MWDIHEEGQVGEVAAPPPGENHVCTCWTGCSVLCDVGHIRCTLVTELTPAPSYTLGCHTRDSRRVSTGNMSGSPHLEESEAGPRDILLRPALAV